MPDGIELQAIGASHNCDGSQYELDGICEQEPQNVPHTRTSNSASSPIEEIDVTQLAKENTSNTAHAEVVVPVIDSEALNKAVTKALIFAKNGQQIFLKFFCSDKPMTYSVQDVIDLINLKAAGGSYVANISANRENQKNDRANVLGIFSAKKKTTATAVTAISITIRPWGTEFIDLVFFKQLFYAIKNKDFSGKAGQAALENSATGANPTEEKNPLKMPDPVPGNTLATSAENPTNIFDNFMPIKERMNRLTLQKVGKSIKFYSGNYIFGSLFLLFFQMFLMPYSLLFLIFSKFAWKFFQIKNKDPTWKTVINNYEFSADQRQQIVIGLFFSILSCIVWPLYFCDVMCIICYAIPHAVIRAEYVENYEERRKEFEITNDRGTRISEIP